MGQAGGGEQQSRARPVAVEADHVEKAAEVQHAEKQTERKRELSGHCGQDVSAKNPVGTVEQIGQRGKCQIERRRVREAGFASQPPRRPRQQNRPRNRDELVRNAVRNDAAEANDQPCGQRKVQRQDRDSSEPVIGPAGDLPFRREHSTNICGHTKMTTVVPSRRERVEKNAIDTQPDGENHAQRENEKALMVGDEKPS